VKEVLYGQSSTLIALFLFVSALLAIEAGYRLGRRERNLDKSPAVSQIGAIQGAVLGVLALLLGFTFTLALQRFDERSMAVVEEANAIETAWLRTQLVPAGLKEQADGMMRRYLDLRVLEARANMASERERNAALQPLAGLSTELWTLAIQAVAVDGRAATSGLFVQSLNNMFDAYGRRDAALSRHVPEVVLVLLYVTFMLAGSILGYASGIVRHRVAFPTVVMVTIVVLLVYLIIDLDRPRRGLIQVSHKSLTDLQQKLAKLAPPALAGPSAR